MFIMIMKFMVKDFKTCSVDNILEIWIIPEKSRHLTSIFG
jgi:hypothetical protein